MCIATSFQSQYNIIMPLAQSTMALDASKEPEVVDLSNVPDSPQRKVDSSNVILLLSDSDSDIDENEKEYSDQSNKGTVTELEKHQSPTLALHPKIHTSKQPEEDNGDDDAVIVVPPPDKNIRPAFNIGPGKDDSNNNDKDICLVIGSKGVNVLAHLAHSRENCVNFPKAKSWNGKANRNFCSKCYCYVCDIPASDCSVWEQHCHASHKNKKWRQKRERFRKKAEAEAK